MLGKPFFNNTKITEKKPYQNWRAFQVEQSINQALVATFHSLFLEEKKSNHFFTIAIGGLSVKNETIFNALIGGTENRLSNKWKDVGIRLWK